MHISGSIIYADHPDLVIIGKIFSYCRSFGQKWKKGQGLSGLVTAGTGVNGLNLQKKGLAGKRQSLTKNDMYITGKLSGVLIVMVGF